MDASNTSTDAKEVELTEEHATPTETEKASQSVDVKVTFCTHVGWDGVLLMLFKLIVAGLFGYATYEYTSYFNNFHREFVWLFMMMGLLYVMVVVYYLLRWKHIANTFMEEERKTQEQETEEAATTFFERVKAIYNSFQIFGKYYLWQLYTSEICESINQVINTFTVYNCSLPVGVTTGMCIALSIDCFHTVSFMARENNSNRRDRQIVVDTSVDFFCTALPILLMWFGYKVPISVQDMIQIAFFPAFMMLLKLDTILEEIIRSRTAAATIKVQEETAKAYFRRRKSLYRGLSHFEIADQQQAAVPRVVHMGAAGCKFAFGLMFLIIAIVQLAVQHNTTCEPLLWDSCKVKTPFCGNAFTPTCNCVVLNVRNHTWTALPNEIQEMNALKVMQINHGPLEVIPDGLDKQFSKVSVLDLSNNELTEVPESLGSMKINKLLLLNNNLVGLPDSVWGNKFLFQLEVDNNNISKISPLLQTAQSLMHFMISNNSLSILPNEIFVNSKTNINSKLVSLFVDGNYLKEIPESISYATTLKTFGINNNYIANVPKQIGVLKSLSYIDLRNNSINNLPKGFIDLKDSLTFVYLHNNPICSNGWLDKEKDIKMMVEKGGAGCNKQCSIYCQDRFKGNGVCDAYCNAALCEFDGGDCINAS
eukprot:g1012.t1